MISGSSYLIVILERADAPEARSIRTNWDDRIIPKPGEVAELVWPSGEGVRVDAGVRAPGRVTPYYDPMIAKIIAHGDTRADAIERLHRALGETRVAPLVTNLAFLQSVLRADEFVAGSYDTGFAEVFAKRK